jgi:hypothetical protein
VCSTDQLEAAQSSQLLLLFQFPTVSLRLLLQHSTTACMQAADNDKEGAVSLAMNAVRLSVGQPWVQVGGWQAL